VEQNYLEHIARCLEPNENVFAATLSIKHGVYDSETYFRNKIDRYKLESLTLAEIFRAVACLDHIRDHLLRRRFELEAAERDVKRKMAAMCDEIFGGV
jgi:hypothetical protein